MSVSTAFANAALNASITGTYYVGLLVGGTEVSGGAYVRQSATFAAASAGSKANAADITYPTATSAWGTIDGWALFSASSGGTALVTGVVSPGVPVASGGQYKFPPGAIAISMT